MKLVLTELYNQATRRFLYSLNKASIPYLHINVVYGGFEPLTVLNPIAHAIGADQLPDKALHFNEIKVPKFFEIRNIDGLKAEILQGDLLRGYIFYIANSKRIVKKVVWLNLEGKFTVAFRYNRQGFKYADVLYNQEGKPIKEIYYDANGNKVLTFDLLSRSIIRHTQRNDKIYPDISFFVKEFIEEYSSSFDEIIINSMSTPFLVSKEIPKIPSTLYFQERISDELPANMKLILSVRTSTYRILFENINELAKIEKIMKPYEEGRIGLAYLGQIENIRRSIKQHRSFLTVTLSDQILYDEGLADYLSKSGATWTIAAPSNVSEKLRNLAKKHSNVRLLEAISLKNLLALLLENDVYLDLNQGAEWENVVQRAYLEGLLVIGDRTVAKSQANELITETQTQISELISKSDYSEYLHTLHEKKGKPSSVHDYQKIFK
ncbi:hypothetical protein [Lactovum miscens]|uniref:Accessory Sec system glycosyltransferase GtfB n=1 Tax=Lactovum miscens TaxID=190387 RepID=A0A841C561_9LACT|nr:hypothetical protein [Lactovum miscens]MBB5887407.1 accessory Sec system glycosyltransferase GtfB [Lactovum miscens]